MSLKLATKPDTNPVKELLDRGSHYLKECRVSHQELVEGIFPGIELSCQGVVDFVKVHQVCAIMIGVLEEELSRKSSTNLYGCRRRLIEHGVYDNEMLCRAARMLCELNVIEVVANYNLPDDIDSPFIIFLVDFCFSDEIEDGIETLLSRGAERPLLRWEYGATFLVERKIKTHKRVSIKKKTRFRVIQRDGFRCVSCGKSSEDGAKLQVDHIIPVSRGGKNRMSNYQTLCQDCNLGKMTDTVCVKTAIAAGS